MRGNTVEVGLIDVEVLKFMVPYGTWMAPLFPAHVLPGITRYLGLNGLELSEMEAECLRCLAGEDGKQVSFY